MSRVSAQASRALRGAALALLAALAVPAAAIGVSAAPGAPPQSSRLSDGESWVATVIAPTQARAAPGVHAARLMEVAPMTAWSTPQTLLVLRIARGPEGLQWLLVRLDVRPNGRAAWIYADDTVIGVDPWRIEVSRAQRRLRVYLHGSLLRVFRVVVGKPSTPTPGGLFAINAELLQADPHDFLGAWVMPLTAHSEVLKSFEGGDGQVALHGRGGESLQDPLGSARSHGCVRMANESIGWIAVHVPVGTPVQIT